MSRPRPHSQHEPGGFSTADGAAVLCGCGRRATWRRRRNSKPTLYRCGQCRAQLRTEETR